MKSEGLININTVTNNKEFEGMEIEAKGVTFGFGKNGSVSAGVTVFGIGLSYGYSLSDGYSIDLSNSNGEKGTTGVSISAKPGLGCMMIILGIIAPETIPIEAATIPVLAH